MELAAGWHPFNTEKRPLSGSQVDRGASRGAQIELRHTKTCSLRARIGSRRVILKLAFKLADSCKQTDCHLWAASPLILHPAIHSSIARARAALGREISSSPWGFFSARSLFVSHRGCDSGLTTKGGLSLRKQPSDSTMSTLSSLLDQLRAWL